MESLLTGYFDLICATVLYFAPLAERLGRKLDGTDKSKGPAGIPSFLSLIPTFSLLQNEPKQIKTFVCRFVLVSVLVHGHNGLKINLKDHTAIVSWFMPTIPQPTKDAWVDLTTVGLLVGATRISVDCLSESILFPCLPHLEWGELMARFPPPKWNLKLLSQSSCVFVLGKEDCPYPASRGPAIFLD